MSLQSILEATGADPAALSLEVTESVLLADEPRVHAVLNGVKDLGVALSLDDFGTGYSSLSYLRRFPFDAVKIDRSFTANLPTDRATRSITSAMIDLSHVLDLTVVAEGVETARELSEVEGLGADQAQGFHFSRPLAFDESGVSISLPYGPGVALLAGRDYPKSYAELRAWFDEDWKCLDYLDWFALA